MNQTKLLITMKDIQRFNVLKHVINKKLTGSQAAQLLGLTYVHVSRLKKKLLTGGFEALLRKSPPSPPNKKITESKSSHVHFFTFPDVSFQRLHNNFFCGFPKFMASFNRFIDDRGLKKTFFSLISLSLYPRGKEPLTLSLSPLWRGFKVRGLPFRRERGNFFSLRTFHKIYFTYLLYFATKSGKSPFLASEKVLFLVCHCEPEGRGPDKSGLHGVYPEPFLRFFAPLRMTKAKGSQ